MKNHPEKNKEVRRIVSARYLSSKEHKDRLKIELVGAYGNKCACCGETNIGFLTIDHINNDGYKEKHHGVFLYRRLKKENWPDYVRLLCFNCNCGRHFNILIQICNRQI